MKHLSIISLVSFLALALAFSSCQRENLDELGDPVWEETEPGVIYIDTITSSSAPAITMNEDFSNMEISHSFGNGLVEDNGLGGYFMTVLIRHNEVFDLPYFLLTWNQDEIAPGSGTGEYATFATAEGDDIVAGSLVSDDTHYNVMLDEIGDFFEPMRGRFDGIGLLGSNGETVNFSGTFSVTRKVVICGDEVLIDENHYASLESKEVEIKEIEIKNQCINFKMNTCPVHPTNTNTVLLDSGEIIDGEIPSRTLRIVSQSTDPCPDLEEKNIGFSLEGVKVPGHSSVLLNIEGWEDPILFEY